jgi:outer membrane biosynthesis protein TonB
VTVTDLAAAPRKLRDRKPALSDDVRAIRTHGGVLVYQVTIGASGDVTEVKLVKPVDTQEPWPTLAESWRAAILDWRYEPTVVNGKPMAVCMTATVTIDVM